MVKETTDAGKGTAHTGDKDYLGTIALNLL